MEGTLYFVASVASVLSQFQNGADGQRIWMKPEWRPGDLGFATRKEALMAGLDLLEGEPFGMYTRNVNKFAIVHVAGQLPNANELRLAPSLTNAQHYFLGKTPDRCCIGQNHAVCLIEVVCLDFVWPHKLRSRLRELRTELARRTS